MTRKSIFTLQEEENDELKYLIRAKARARKRWQQYGDIQAKRAYYRYQRAIRRKRQQASFSNFEKRVNQIDQSGKEFWSFTKCFLGKNSHARNTPIHDTNGEISYDPQRKVDILAKSFEQRFHPHQQPSDPVFTEDIKNKVQYILRSPTTTPLSHVSPKEVSIIIKHLPLHKSPGPDKITPIS